jgi:Fe-S-cluster containining protein
MRDLAVREPRFECSACGKCCYGGDGYQVAVSDDDIISIANYLGISLAWLKRRYLEKDGDMMGIGFREDSACHFLQGNACRIYPVRPLQCRTYPWWPEILCSPEAWQQEARRCEGIGRGNEVPLETVMENLRQARNA